MTSLPPVTTRRELIYLLSVAAELEHSLACQYLYAAFSLKQPGDGGLTPAQMVLIRGWSATLIKVATQEMLHLSLACNLLTAVGGAPNLRRPNFPQLATTYVLGMPSELTPFNEDALIRYMCWEKPEEPGEWDDICASQATPTQDLLPSPDPLDIDKRRYTSLGELYQLIDTAFDAIPASRLFIGPPATQASQEYLPFSPPLIRVIDPSSAHDAIQLIILEGEGTPEHTEHSHYASFANMLAELRAAVQADPAFNPARPVIENPLYDMHFESYTPQANRVGDPVTRRVGMVFNACYDLMLQLLMRFFAHTEETPDQLRTLANACMSLMSGVIRPVGVMLTRMPAGNAAFPDCTAGPSFELYLDTKPLPHLGSAWIYARECFAQIADECEVVARMQGAPSELAEVAMMLDFWRTQFAVQERGGL